MKYGQPVVYFMDEHIQYLKTFLTYPHMKMCRSKHNALKKLPGGTWCNWEDKIEKKSELIPVHGQTVSALDVCCFIFFCYKGFQNRSYVHFLFFLMAVKIQKQEQESDTCGISPVNLS